MKALSAFHVRLWVSTGDKSLSPCHMQPVGLPQAQGGSGKIKLLEVQLELSALRDNPRSCLQSPRCCLGGGLSVRWHFLLLLALGGCWEAAGAPWICWLQSVALCRCSCWVTGQTATPTFLVHQLLSYIRLSASVCWKDRDLQALSGGWRKLQRGSCLTASFFCS